MRVNLTSDWFGPDGNLYRRIDNPVEIDDDFKKLIPGTAKVLGGKEVKLADADAAAAAAAQRALLGKTDEATAKKLAEAEAALAKASQALKEAEEATKAAEEKAEAAEKRADAAEVALKAKAPAAPPVKPNL